MGNFSHRHHCPDPPDVRHPHELGHEVCRRGVIAHLAQGAFCVRRLWHTERDNSEVAELINLPFEEKTVILYKNKKTSIIHQFKYKVKKSINRRGEK